MSCKGRKSVSEEGEDAGRTSARLVVKEAQRTALIIDYLCC